jgi:hypothetical protein
MTPSRPPAVGFEMKTNSAMTNTFLLGMTVGVWITAAVAFLTCRCRFGWHKWRPWRLPANGTAQFRTCERCGFWHVKPFVNFTVRQANAESGGSDQSAETVVSSSIE